MAKDDRCKLLAHFDRLPDDAIADTKLTAAVIGCSRWTIDRNPPIRRRQLSARRVGYRVGDIRAFVRGTTSSAA